MTFHKAGRQSRWRNMVAWTARHRPLIRPTVTTLHPDHHRQACQHLRNVDPVMAAVIDQVGEDARLRLRDHEEPFHSLVRAVISQQLSTRAAATIFGRFIQLFAPAPFPSASQVLAMDSELLRSRGLSRPKLAYIRDIAQQALNQSLPTLSACAQLSDAEIVETLTQVKGVGRWTAEMFLMFNLGRPDVLPVHDLGVRKGFQIAFKKRILPKPEQLDRYGKRWRPYRSTAALYLWRAADL